MADTQKKRLGQIIMMGSTIVLLLYVTGIGISNYFRYNRFKQDYNRLEEKVNLLQKKNKEYRAQIQQFSSPEYWELQAKQQLGYCKEGELQFVVIPADKGALSK